MNRVLGAGLLVVCISVSACSFQAAGFNVEKLEHQEYLGSIEISWPRKTLDVTEGFVLLRKSNSCPSHLEDGQEIYRGNGNKFTDSGVADGDAYCYGLFIISSIGRNRLLAHSDIIEKKSLFAYMLAILESNYMIEIGAVIIVVLLYVNKRTMRQRDKLAYSHIILKP